MKRFKLVIIVQNEQSLRICEGFVQLENFIRSNLYFNPLKGFESLGGLMYKILFVNDYFIPAINFSFKAT